MIIDRGKAEVDNHFRSVNILTITLSGMYYLFYHIEIIKCICRRPIIQTESTSFWHNRTKVRELRRFVLEQGYDVISDVHDNGASNCNGNCTGCSNLVSDSDEINQIRVLIVMSLKSNAIQKRTVRASMQRM